MPLYEYECTQCGKRIEKIQKFSDAPLTLCEKCGGRLKRLVSSSAIQFKGSGWYVTDYGKNASNHAAKNSAGSANEGKEKGAESPKKEVVSAKTNKD